MTPGSVTRRSLVRAAVAGAGFAAVSCGLSGCGPRRLEIAYRWRDCRYFALREIDGRAALIGWSAADLVPRVLADLGPKVIGWQVCPTPSGALVGWVPEGGTTRFGAIDPSRSIVTAIGAELDTGAFAVVGDTVQVVAPGPEPAVVSYDGRLSRRLTTARLDMDIVVALRGTPEGALALGTDRAGEVLVAEIPPLGRRTQVWRTGVRGLPADVARVGALTAVSVVRDPESGVASRSCLVLGGVDSPARVLRGWTRPGAMTALGRHRFAVADSVGAGRVVRVVDAASGSVVAEHPLTSPQTVLGLAAAGAAVMVLQQDALTLVGGPQTPVTTSIAGLLPGQW